MLKERAQIVAGSLLAVDLFLVTLAFLLAFWLRSQAFPSWGLSPTHLYPLEQYLPLLPITLVIWWVLLYRSKLYRSQRTVPLQEEARDILRITISAAVLLILIIYALRLDDRLLGGDKISRAWILLQFVLAAFFLLSRMMTVRILARYVRERGYNYRTVLIVGTGATAGRIAESVEQHGYWGIRILGLVAEDRQTTLPDGSPYPLIGALDELPELVEENVVDEVIFGLDQPHPPQLEGLLLALEEQGVRSRVALSFLPHTKAKAEVGALDDLPLLTYDYTPASELQLLAKRAMDVFISSMLLAVALPAMLLIAALLKLAGGGGRVLFTQTRCGLNGRRFTLYKFRTMVEDAENQRHEIAHLNEMSGPVFKVRRDPRVTPVGRWLRQFSLDELPQLWNVLRGDMSLVGPRPPVPQEVSQYQRWQRRRLSMRPGLTCLWQVQGRNELDFDRWVELDLEYIDSWSPLLDIKILLKTIPVVLSGKGAH
jgi:exopolysaccharide biosynthesis polyprenyl glycosylphosphotransferase